MSDEHLNQEEIVLPEQVRRQMARATELQQSLNPPRDPPEDDEDTTGSEEPSPPAREEPPPPAHEEPSDATAEQRYRTLKGKYDSEVPALRAQVNSLERLIASMQTPPQPQHPQPVQGQLAFEEGDVDIYGQDFLEAAARAAAARYEPIIAQLEQKINRLEGGQQNLQSKNLQDVVFAELDNDPELNGWRELNTNERFLQWLQEPDEYAGIPRNDMLQHAYRSGDAIRTGRFFKKYMAEHTVPRTSRGVPQTGRAARPNGNGQQVAARNTRLEDMVVPGRAAGPNGGPGNGAHNPRIWSRSEISRFYRERTDGKWRGREAESEQLERDILAASTEGRIH